MARHKIERRRAIEVVRINQLKIGHVVNSVAWVAPRVLRSIDSAGVAVLAEVREDGTLKAELMMSSLPIDAHLFGHPARPTRGP